MEEKDLIKLSPKELTDLGYCATCLNRKYNGAIYGDDSLLKIFEDKILNVYLCPIQEQKGI